MFGSKSRRIADLEARVTGLVEERDEARAASAVHLNASRRTAGRNTHLSEQLDAAQTEVRRLGNRAATALRTVELDDETLIRHERRIDRLARACARYRRDLSASARRIDKQQKRLDDALGLNAPDVVAGALWQQRRTDKQGAK